MLTGLVCVTLLVIDNLRRLDEMPSHQQRQRPGDNREQFGWDPSFYGGGFPYGGFYY